MSSSEKIKTFLEKNKKQLFVLLIVIILVFVVLFFVKPKNITTKETIYFYDEKGKPIKEGRVLFYLPGEKKPNVAIIKDGKAEVPKVKGLKIKLSLEGYSKIEKTLSFEEKEEIYLEKKESKKITITFKDSSTNTVLSERILLNYRCFPSNKTETKLITNGIFEVELSEKCKKVFLYITAKGYKPIEGKEISSSQEVLLVPLGETKENASFEGKKEKEKKTLKVVVYDKETKEGIKGISIILYDKDKTGIVDKKKTSSRGSVIFRNLENDEYIIVAKDSNYQDGIYFDKEKEVVLSSKYNREDIYLTLSDCSKGTVEGNKIIVDNKEACEIRGNEVYSLISNSLVGFFYNNNFIPKDKKMIEIITNLPFSGKISCEKEEISFDSEDKNRTKVLTSCQHFLLSLTPKDANYLRYSEEITLNSPYLQKQITFERIQYFYVRNLNITIVSKMPFNGRVLLKDKNTGFATDIDVPVVNGKAFVRDVPVGEYLLYIYNPEISYSYTSQPILVEKRTQIEDENIDVNIKIDFGKVKIIVNSDEGIKHLLIYSSGNLVLQDVFSENRYEKELDAYNYYSIELSNETGDNYSVFYPSFLFRENQNISFQKTSRKYGEKIKANFIKALSSFSFDKSKEKTKINPGEEFYLLFKLEIPYLSPNSKDYETYNIKLSSENAKVLEISSFKCRDDFDSFSVEKTCPLEKDGIYYILIKLKALENLSLGDNIKIYWNFSATDGNTTFFAYDESRLLVYTVGEEKSCNDFVCVSYLLYDKNEEIYLEENNINPLKEYELNILLTKGSKNPDVDTSFELLQVNNCREKKITQNLELTNLSFTYGENINPTRATPPKEYHFEIPSFSKGTSALIKTGLKTREEGRYYLLLRFYSNNRIVEEKCVELISSPREDFSVKIEGLLKEKIPSEIKIRAVSNNEDLNNVQFNILLYDKQTETYSQISSFYGNSPWETTLSNLSKGDKLLFSVEKEGYGYVEKELVVEEEPQIQVPDKKNFNVDVLEALNGFVAENIKIKNKEDMKFNVSIEVLGTSDYLNLSAMNSYYGNYILDKNSTLEIPIYVKAYDLALSLVNPLEETYFLRLNFSSGNISFTKEIEINPKLVIPDAPLDRECIQLSTTPRKLTLSKKGTSSLIHLTIQNNCFFGNNEKIEFRKVNLVFEKVPINASLLYSNEEINTGSTIELDLEDLETKDIHVSPQEKGEGTIKIKVVGFSSLGGYELESNEIEIPVKVVSLEECISFSLDGEDNYNYFINKDGENYIVLDFYSSPSSFISKTLEIKNNCDMQLYLGIKPNELTEGLRLTEKDGMFDKNKSLKVQFNLDSGVKPGAYLLPIYVGINKTDSHIYDLLKIIIQPKNFVFNIKEDVSSSPFVYLDCEEECIPTMNVSIYYRKKFIRENASYPLEGINDVITGKKDLKDLLAGNFYILKGEDPRNASLLNPFYPDGRDFKLNKWSRKSKEHGVICINCNKEEERKFKQSDGFKCKTISGKKYCYRESNTKGKNLPSDYLLCNFREPERMKTALICLDGNNFGRVSKNLLPLLGNVDYEYKPSSNECATYSHVDPTKAQIDAHYLLEKCVAIPIPKDIGVWNSGDSFSGSFASYSPMDKKDLIIVETDEVDLSNSSVLKGKGLYKIIGSYITAFDKGNFSKTENLSCGDGWSSVAYTVFKLCSTDEDECLDDCQINDSFSSNTLSFSLTCNSSTITGTGLAAGCITGGGIGAGIGSVIPGIGTAVGAAAGCLIGVLGYAFMSLDTYHGGVLGAVLCEREEIENSRLKDVLSFKNINLYNDYEIKNYNFIYPEGEEEVRFYFQKNVPLFEEPEQPLEFEDCSLKEDLNITYTWNPSEINKDFCENNYCDGTQLIISILKRLKELESFVKENKDSFSCSISNSQTTKRGEILSFNEKENVSNIEVYEDENLNLEITLEEIPEVYLDPAWIEKEKAYYLVVVGYDDKEYETLATVKPTSETIFVKLPKPTNKDVFISVLYPENPTDDPEELANGKWVVFARARFNYKIDINNKEECLLEKSTRFTQIDKMHTYLDFWSGTDVGKELTHFSAKLMTENYNENLVKDLNFSYSGVTGSFYSLPNEYRKFLSKIKFKNSILEPGEYKVNISVFFNDNWDINNIEVSFVPLKTIRRAKAFLFYLLPVEQLIGLEQDGLNRKNYGITPNNPLPIILEDEKQLILQPSSTMNGLRKVNYIEKDGEDAFYYSNVQFPSVLFKIERQNNIYKMLLSKTNPSKVKMEIKPECTNCRVEVYYEVLKDEVGISPDEVVVPWYGYGDRFFTGSYPKRQYMPEILQINGKNYAGFIWRKEEVRTKDPLKLATIFFIPDDSTYKIKTCASNARVVVETESGKEEGDCVILNLRVNNRFRSLKSIVEGIKRKELCVVGNREKLVVKYNISNILEGE